MKKLLLILFFAYNANAVIIPTIVGSSFNNADSIYPGTQQYVLVTSYPSNQKFTDLVYFEYYDQFGNGGPSSKYIRHMEYTGRADSARRLYFNLFSYMKGSFYLRIYYLNASNQKIYTATVTGLIKMNTTTGTNPGTTPGINTTPGVNTSTGVNTVTGTVGGVNTTTGNNTSTGVNTVSGTNTTTGVNTLTGNNTLTGIVEYKDGNLGEFIELFYDTKGNILDKPKGFYIRKRVWKDRIEIKKFYQTE